MQVSVSARRCRLAFSGSWAGEQNESTHCLFFSPRGGWQVGADAEVVTQLPEHRTVACEGERCNRSRRAKLSAASSLFAIAGRAHNTSVDTMASATTGYTSFVLCQWWVSPPPSPPPAAHAPSAATRKPDKHNHLLDPTRHALMAHTERWCKSSSCCAAYVRRSFTAAEAATALPGNWGKVLIVRTLLRERMMPVMLLDADAFIAVPAWCPRWASDHNVLMLAPDPQPWRNPANSGFFLIRPTQRGFELLDAWWRVFRSENVSKCWAPSGECDGCRRDRSICRFPCTNGGRCADQGGLNGAVIPTFRRWIQQLPRGFQDASLRCKGEAHCSAEDRCVVCQ